MAARPVPLIAGQPGQQRADGASPERARPAARHVPALPWRLVSPG